MFIPYLIHQRPIRFINVTTSVMKGYKVKQKSGKHKGGMRFFLVLLYCCLVNPTHGLCDTHCSQCEEDDCRECNYGYWGQNCYRQCIGNCWFGGCEKESGRCIQCEPGLHGVHCNKRCPGRCWSSIYDDRADCNRHTGKCLEGCEVGWWGEQCQNRCSAGCQGSCYQHDGACITDCRKGLFGRFCNKTCSAGCAEGTCDWLTGSCHGGCKCGYKASTCTDDCSSKCNTPCRFDDESQCLTCVNICQGQCLSGRCYQNGSCVDGCLAGFYGEDCTHACPSDCSACEMEADCLSCFDDELCQHISNEVIIFVETGDGTRELTGGASLKPMCFVLFIGCLLSAQLLKIESK